MKNDIEKKYGGKVWVGMMGEVRIDRKLMCAVGDGGGRVWGCVMGGGSVCCSTCDGEYKV